MNPSNVFRFHRLSRHWPGVSRGLLLLCAALPQLGFADSTGGAIEAHINGQRIEFPLLKTDISVDLSGDLASVLVEQTFSNPSTQALNATYLFPLNHDAAVHEMVMQVGDERVQAQIQRKEEARQTFHQAQAEGKSAALLEQHRPNMFTQTLANLMPGLPIRVSLRYVQTVPRVDGAYELVVPLVVGPRFQPAGAGEPPRQEPASADAAEEIQVGEWELEALPRQPPTQGVHLPASIDADRVSLAVRLNAGMPILSARSPTHSLMTEADSEQSWRMSLATGRTIDNRDFVLRYSLAGANTQTGWISQVDERGGFFSLLIEPPQVPDEAEIVRREMVFLLDCSGSMRGEPMAASKAFMREALAALRPGDYFRIIRFSDGATEFSRVPLPATPANIQRGQRYAQNLRGGGGTHMASGISQALKPALAAGVVRIVTLLTDGYIGNEYSVLKQIEEQRRDARIYAFGVGTGVNRYLLEEAAYVGRGFARFLDPTAEDLETVAAEFAQRLDAPLLTDIEMDWGELPITEVYPQRIPDLFAGDSVRVQGRFDPDAMAAGGVVRVRGNARGHRAALPLAVPALARTAQGEIVHDEAPALPQVWARSAVAQAMRDIGLPPDRQPANYNLPDWKERVVKLGLDFDLVTRWTSFVAVSERIYNHDPASTPIRPVPLNKVAGVSKSAYPNAGGTAFVGAAGPEPSVWAGLFLVGLILLLTQTTRRRVWAAG